MHQDTPLAFFITWTVYGTFLQGDERGWRKRQQGEQLPQPNLARWRNQRLKHPVKLLDQAQRAAVDNEVQRLANYRSWRLWAHSVRTNHVHIVVTAADHTGSKVRDQLKANSTRILRELWPCWQDRPVWTTGGDWKIINDAKDLEQVVFYVSEAQSRGED